MPQPRTYSVLFSCFLHLILEFLKVLHGGLGMLILIILYFPLANMKDTLFGIMFIIISGGDKCF